MTFLKGFHFKIQMTFMANVNDNRSGEPSVKIILKVKESKLFLS